MADVLIRKRLIIFDKDGTLCSSVIDKKTGKSHAPNRLEDQDYFPDVEAKCNEMIAQGHVLAVASNQGGVAFGIFEADEAELLVRAAAEYIGALAYRVCFYHPKGKIAPYNADSYNRKPQPGMIESLMQEFGFSPQDTVMVGDWESDQQAAKAAGCAFEWTNDFFKRDDPFAARLHSILGSAE